MERKDTVFPRAMKIGLMHESWSSETRRHRKSTGSNDKFSCGPWTNFVSKPFVGAFAIETWFESNLVKWIQRKEIISSFFSPEMVAECMLMLNARMVTQNSKILSTDNKPKNKKRGLPPPNVESAILRSSKAVTVRKDLWKKRKKNEMYGKHAPREK